MSNQQHRQQTRILVADPRNDNTGSNSKKVSTTYNVSTPHSSVRRRYSDFQWLQSRLGQEYPGAIVPIILHQRPGMNRLDPDFIEQRRHALQRFIQSILDHPEFYNSTTYWQSSMNETSNDLSALRIFLTIPLGDDFEFAKKISESSDATSNIAIASASGMLQRVDLSFDDQNANEGSNETTDAEATAVTMEDLKPASTTSKFGRGLSKMFNKAMTTMHVTAGNVELVETSYESQIIAVTSYVNQVEGHVSQLLKNVQAIVKLTGDQATQFHEFGVPIALWRTTDQNNTFASAAVAAVKPPAKAVPASTSDDHKKDEDNNKTDDGDGDDGEKTTVDTSNGSNSNSNNNDNNKEERSIMNTMTRMVQFSTDYSELLDKKYGEEKMKFLEAIESISLDLKAFQFALKQRHDLRVLCTSKIKKVADKQSQINKARGKDPETVAKQISKLELELKDQRQNADISKKLLDECTKRIIRESDRTKLQYEYSLKDCLRSYAKLQIQYNEKLNDSWMKMLPHLE